MYKKNRLERNDVEHLENAIPEIPPPVLLTERIERNTLEEVHTPDQKL